MWMNFSHYSQLIAYAIAYFPHLLQMSETERQEKTRTLLAEIGELLAEGGPCNQENIMHLQLLVAGLNADLILFAVEQALLCLPKRSRGATGPSTTRNWRWMPCCAASRNTIRRRRTSFGITLSGLSSGN